MVRSESPKKLSHGRREKWDTTGILVDWLLADGPIDLREVYGNSRPVELEIGVGKGTFILARAAARPELNLLGIEWAGGYCRYAADRIRRARLVNARMLHTDATHFVRRCLGDESIWRVHMYFPDPWPKRRHHQRRSIQVDFVCELWRILTPGGQLCIVTDHMDYFLHIRRTLSCVPGLTAVAFPRTVDESEQLVGTNFERKYTSQGRSFFSAAVMKYC